MIGAEVQHAHQKVARQAYDAGLGQSVGHVVVIVALQVPHRDYDHARSVIATFQAFDPML